MRDDLQASGLGHGMTDRRIIIGISGASGIVYGIRTLQIMRDLGIETHLVMSKGADMTLGYETDMTARDVRALATYVHPPADIGANISSGSFKTLGMLIVPCSVRTMERDRDGRHRRR